MEPISTPDAEEQLLIPLRLVPLRPLRPKRMKIPTGSSPLDFDPTQMNPDLISLELEVGPSVLYVYGSLLRNFLHVKVRTPLENICLTCVIITNSFSLCFNWDHFECNVDLQWKNQTWMVNCAGKKATAEFWLEIKMLWFLKCFIVDLNWWLVLSATLAPSVVKVVHPKFFLSCLLPNYKVKPSYLCQFLFTFLQVSFAFETDAYFLYFKFVYVIKSKLARRLWRSSSRWFSPRLQYLHC